jgi:hypothetical protein
MCSSHPTWWASIITHDGMRPILIFLALLLRSVLIKKINLSAEVISMLILIWDLGGKNVIGVINDMQ